MRKIDIMNFITICFERSNSTPNTIYAIAMVKYENGNKVDSFYSLLKPPELCIQPKIDISHNYITENELENAPTLRELWKEKIYPFIDNFIIISKGNDCDIDLLLANIEWFGLPRPILKYVDFFSIMYKVWPAIKNAICMNDDLKNLIRKYKIEYNENNIIEEAEVYGKILLIAAEKLHCKSLYRLLKKTKQKTTLKAKSKLNLWENILDDSVDNFSLKELEPIESELFWNEILSGIETLKLLGKKQ